MTYPFAIKSQTPSQAQALQARGEWKSAEEVWRQLLKGDANDYRLWASLGIVLSQENRYDEAVESYHKALALHPNDAQTQLNLGIAYFKQGRFLKATAPLLSAVKSLGDTPRTDLLLGMSLYGAGYYRQAILHLERASAREPKGSELQRTLGQAYLHSGEYDKAMAEFKKMLSEDPDSASVHMMMGEAYDAGNREEAAITEFRSAAQGNYVPNAHFGLGYLLWKAHSYDEANAEFQKELEKDPRNSQALAYLGDIALKQGDARKAEALLRRSVTLRNDDHIAFVDLGIIETENKQYQLAEQHLKRAVSLRSSEADAHYRLARLYRLTGRPAKAAREFAMVKQVDQHNTDDLVFKVSGNPPVSPPVASTPR